jgi:hypothetical protein
MGERMDGDEFPVDSSPTIVTSLNYLTKQLFL